MKKKTNPVVNNYRVLEHKMELNEISIGKYTDNVKFESRHIEFMEKYLGKENDWNIAHGFMEKYLNDKKDPSINPMLTENNPWGEFNLLNPLLLGNQHEFEPKNNKQLYYLSNKEKIAIRGAIYRSKNREKIRKRKREYYMKNKEKFAMKKREYIKKNIEKVKKSSRDYYTRNREKINEKRRELRLRKHKEKTL